MTIDLALEKLIPGLQEIYGDLIDSIVLYGSTARGTRTEDSDVDVAILLRAGATKAMREQMLDLVVDLELECGRCYLFSALIMINLRSGKTFFHFIKTFKGWYCFMAGSLTVLSAHRFGRAKEELQTAELLLKNANFRSSINRSYYAIFHAIRAVNALDGFDSSKHSGVIAHFNQEYVKTGVFEKGASKIIRNASELREQADYEDFYEATQEEASDVFMQASQFISEVERYLHSKAIL